MTGRKPTHLLGGVSTFLSPSRAPSSRWHGATPVGPNTDDGSVRRPVSPVQPRRPVNRSASPCASNQQSLDMGTCGKSLEATSGTAESNHNCSRPISVEALEATSCTADSNGTHNCGTAISVEASSGSGFHALVNSSLEELNHMLTIEFDRVRKQDLMRMHHLERQVVLHGGSLQSPELSDPARMGLQGTTQDGSSKTLSVEASTDVDPARTDGPNSQERPSPIVSVGMDKVSTSHGASLPQCSAEPRAVTGEPSTTLMAHDTIDSACTVIQPLDLKPATTDAANSKSPPDMDPPVLVQDVGDCFLSSQNGGCGILLPEEVHRTEEMGAEMRRGHDSLVSVDNEKETVQQTAIMTVTDLTENGMAVNNTIGANVTQTEETSENEVEQNLTPQRGVSTEGERPSCTYGCNGSQQQMTVGCASHLGSPAPSAWGCQSLSDETADVLGDLHSPARKSCLDTSFRSESSVRKSCRFTAEFEEVHPQSFVNDDDDEEDDHDENGARLTECATDSRIAGVKNSLEADSVKFQLLATWLECKAPSGIKRLVHSKQDTYSSEALGQDCEEDDDSEDDRPRHTCATFMVHPTKGTRVLWDVFAAFFVCYECVVIPLQYIDVRETTGTIVIAWFLRIFWTVDLPLSFMTGFVLSDGTNEMRPWYVAKNYCKTWFLLDLLMVLADWFDALLGTLQFLGGARSVKMLKTVRLCRMVRVVRFFQGKKLPDVFETWMENVFSPDLIPVVFSFAKVVSVFAWMNHFMACLWVKLGEGQYGEKNWIVGHEFVGEPQIYIYACAYHWSLQQFAGAAEVWPWNPTERNFAVSTGVLTFVGSVMFVSSLTSSMTHLEIVTEQDSRRLAQLKQWLYDCGISNTVAIRVQRNAQFALKEEKKNIPESGIELLPTISEPLRMEIHYDMHMHVFAQHSFFRMSDEASPWMMRRVCHQATSAKKISRGDMLFCSGEMPQLPRMYFIKSGNLRYSHLTGTRETITAGSWASEGSLWTMWTHCGDLQATSDCQLIVVEVSKFQSITQEFSRHRDMGKQYGLLYVRHLNSCKPAELTDLEDPEMDIEWLVMQACPGLIKHGGLMAKMLRSSRTSHAAVGGGSVAFMEKRPLQRQRTRDNLVNRKRQMSAASTVGRSSRKTTRFAHQ